MTRSVLPVLALGLALAACGGQSNDPTIQVRDAVRQLTEDARDHHWGDYCAKSTAPDKCESAVMTATAMGVDASQFVPSPDTIETMRVEVHGDRATVDATAAKDATWVKRDGRWLWVWDGS